MREITKEQAKAFLLIKHGLINDYKYSGKEGIMSFIEHVGCVQFDPVDICGRNADLILFSRIKNYRKSNLEELLYKDRVLIDQWDKNMCIYPLSSWAPLTRMRARNQSHYDANLINHSELIEEVTDILSEKEYVDSSDLKPTDPSHFYSWRHKNLGMAVLNYLFFKGEAIIHHRDGVKRYFALARKNIDQEILNLKDPFETQAEYDKFLLKRRIKAVGLLHASPSDAYLEIDFRTEKRKEYINEMIASGELLEICISGIKDSFYLVKEDEMFFDQEITKNRVEFIAPLDSMIWDRKMIKKIFDFEYRWEIYHVPEKRKFAPYTLPILYGTNLIGQIEFGLNRKSRILLVKNIWYKDKKPTKAFQKALEKRVNDFAKFSDCDTVDRSQVNIHIYT